MQDIVYTKPKHGFKPMTIEEKLASAPKRFARQYAVSDTQVFNSTPCWNWTGSKNGLGYGGFHDGFKKTVAHRYSYKLHHGDIADDLDVDHLCRNPSCVNPAHLEAVTHQENLRRGHNVGKRVKIITHCPYGHPYSGDNLIVNAKGQRACRICGRRRTMEHYYRKKAAHSNAPSKIVT